MQNISADFRRVIQGHSHDAPVYVDVDVAPGVTRRVFPFEGHVEVQKYNEVRRTATFRVAGTSPDLIPGGLGDTLSAGSVARPYRGAVIPSVARNTASFRNEADFDTGTYTDTVFTDGALTLG